MADEKVLANFIRTQSSKLGTVAIKDGQLIFLEDSGDIYFDAGTARKSAAENIIEVDDLPLAPIVKKFYIIKDTRKVYIYVNGSWLCLNDIDVSTLSSDSLNTTNKTIVGAINEIYSQLGGGSTITDDTTGNEFKLGIDNGMIYIQQV